MGTTPLIDARGDVAPMLPPLPPAERVFCARNVFVAVLLCCIAMASLVTLQRKWGVDPTGTSNAPQLIYQAESLLHGHWNLSLPPGTQDTAYVGGKVYIAYPPFPSLLLLPLVIHAGVAASDVLLTALVSALSLGVLYLLLEQLRANRLSRRRWGENVAISLFCYFGTITLWLSIGGRMWFTAQIVGLLCTLLALLLAFRRRFGWGALLLGCAFFSRYTAALGFPFLLYLAWQDGGMRHDLERFISSLRARVPDWSAVPVRRLAPVVAIMLLSVGLFMARNLALFGAPLETGYGIINQQHYAFVTDGMFSLHYVPANVVSYFFSFPHILYSGPSDQHPGLDMLNGGIAVGIFVTTPLFLLLFHRNRAFNPLRTALWATVGLILVEALLYQSAGWLQFGARYVFDAYPYLFVLLALSRARLDWRFLVLGMVSVAVNVLGAHQFWTGHIFHV